MIAKTLITILCFAAVGLSLPTVAAAADKAVTPEGVLRTVKSRNFQIVTDLSEEESQELLTRLETMLRLVAAYWGRPHRGVIQMYVAEDFSRWPADMIAKMEPAGVRSIRDGGGLTISLTAVSGNEFRSLAVVYAVAEGGTPQHEAVHAYCTHAFGTCGPVWYSEGMAEVGCYWKDVDDKSVQAPEHVIRFLKESDPKPLQEIVDNPLETSGDSWQNYASRWALCHLLGYNDNYSRRFKPLGLELLNLASRDVSFWQVYGSQAAEIDFEYRQFLENLETGYRVDLCHWDWKTKFAASRGGRPLVSKIRAEGGWQASRLKVVADTEYEYVAEGTWTLAENESPTDATGREDGAGRLIGVVFSDYQLSEPFELGASGTFTPPGSGNLFLRCRDDWGSLADNRGSITVRIKPAGRGRSLLERKLARPGAPPAENSPAEDIDAQ